MDYQVREAEGGKRRVYYRCEVCRAQIDSPLEQAGTEMPCPACRKAQLVPGSAERKEFLHKDMRRAAAAVRAATGQAKERLPENEEEQARRDALPASAEDVDRLLAALAALREDPTTTEARTVRGVAWGLMYYQLLNTPLIVALVLANLWIPSSSGAGAALGVICLIGGGLYAIFILGTAFVHARGE